MSPILHPLRLQVLRYIPLSLSGRLPEDDWAQLSSDLPENQPPRDWLDDSDLKDLFDPDAVGLPGAPEDIDLCGPESPAPELHGCARWLCQKHV